MNNVYKFESPLHAYFQKGGTFDSSNIVFLQVFVETLDKCFENVCELDLIFHVDKVRIISTSWTEIFGGDR